MNSLPTTSGSWSPLSFEPGPRPMATGMRIVIEEVEDGQALADAMFRKKYRSPAPDFPHHIIAFATTQGGERMPLAYLHCTDHGEIMLGGGVCVDSRLLRQLPGDTRAAIRSAGGLYRMSLEWSIRYFETRTKAIFGYCGNALAERIDLAAGFRKTGFPHLLVYFTRDLSEQEKQSLVRLAHSLGPF